MANVSVKSLRAAREFEHKLPKRVSFTPIPFKLVRVGGQPYHFGLIPENNGRYAESVHLDHGEPWAGVLFDPWVKGDPVVVCIRQSMWVLGGGNKQWFSFVVARRYTTHSAARHMVAMSDTYRYPLRDCTELWRIPYRWRPAAEKLIGREFKTREDLEKEMV